MSDVSSIRLPALSSWRTTMTPLEPSIPCICGDPNCNIPYGLCHCGCGQLANISTVTRTRRNYKKGLPTPYVRLHTKGRKPPEQLPEGMCVCLDPLCDIPRGMCHCGCGGQVRVYKGKPRKRIFEHNNKTRIILEEAKPFKIDGVYCRLISLTQGQYAIVWESDYEWLMQWKWHAHWSEEMQIYYAVRGCLKSEGKEKGTIIRMHRFILGLISEDKRDTDHKNGLTLDNRRDNLRPATSSQNSQNAKKMKNNTSGYKGVTFYDNLPLNPWRGRVTLNHKQYDLGYFPTKELAYEARSKKARELHGEFVRFN